MSPGLIAVGVAGGALLLVTLADIFVAVFNYDGFTFLTPRPSPTGIFPSRRSHRLHNPRKRTGENP